MKESAVSNHVRLFAAQNGITLWRNNNGAFQDASGRWVRYGLCNDSTALSNHVKSSDFIGIAPGGIFTAIEIKPSDWTFDETDKRAIAQKNFHDIVKAAGGYAGFVRNIEDFKKIVGLL